MLPTALPVLNVTLSLLGYSDVTSIDPGAVALAYGLLGLFAGGIVMVVYSVIDDQKGVMRLKRWLHLDRLDLQIDQTLDRYSFWMEGHPLAWLIAPQLLLIMVVTVVVGLAALI